MSLKGWWRFLGIVIAITSGVYFAVYAGKYIEDVPAEIWELKNIYLLGFCVVLWAANISLGGLIWKFILKDLNVDLKLWKSTEIYALAQFAKYLPGNVAHHVGRLVLAKAAGIPARTVGHSMLNEFLWSVSAASCVALLGLAYFSYGEDKISAQFLLPVMLVSIALPWIAAWFFNAYRPKFVQAVFGDGEVKAPRFRTMLLCSVAYVSSFLLMGLILDIQAMYLFGSADSHLLMLAGIFAMSWIAGYVVPGAPAGLGVREAVLLSFLTPIYGGSVAVGLSISLRLATTLGDGICFLLALSARQHLNAK